MDLPRRVGRYVIEQRIGRGGMAEVFRAHLDDDGFKKTVCMKRVLPQLAAQPGFADMFRDEAALQARMTHPNLVQALDFVRAEGTLFLVLELVEGVTLKRLMATRRQLDKPLPLTHALHIATCMCRGLHYAHSATSSKGEPLHVVHRDVSPDNVLLGLAGEVKITDFGVARASERLAERTATGVMKGKPGYMAPEQITSELSDHRVDQFTTAVVLWEMLAGRTLFDGKSELDLMEAVVACDVPPLASLRRNVPAGVEAIVRRALSRDPKERFANMAALEAALAPELFARLKEPTDTDLRALVANAEQEVPTVRLARRMDTAPIRDELSQSSDAPEVSEASAVVDAFDDQTALSFRSLSEPSMEASTTRARMTAPGHQSDSVTQEAATVTAGPGLPTSQFAAWWPWALAVIGAVCAGVGLAFALAG